MSFTVADAYGLFALCKKYERDLSQHKKFSWGILRNKKKLLPLIESLEELRKPSEAYMAFDAKRIELCVSLAEKDEQEQPVVVNEQYKIQEGKEEELNKKIEELKEQHKDAIEGRDKALAEVDRILKEEAEVDIYKVSFEYLPKLISSAELDIFEPMIMEDSATI